MRPNLKCMTPLRVIVAVARTMCDQLGFNLTWLTRAGLWRGDLYLSVPVDAVNRTYFSAQRDLTRERIFGECSGVDTVGELSFYSFDVVCAFTPVRGSCRL